MAIGVDQSREDLESYLREHIHFLKASCDSYDRGIKEEAKRLAVTIRVLVHDTAASVSLLSQLNLKNQDFLDTSFPREAGNLASYSGLVLTELGTAGGASYIPLLSDGPFSSKKPYDDWWDGIVIADSNKKEFSRKNLVLTAANKLGGAHVDPKLDPAFRALIKENSMLTFSGARGGQLTPIGGVELASVRQIAHELLATLDPGYTLSRAVQGGMLVAGASVIPYTESSAFPMSSTSGARFPKQPRNERCACNSGKKYKHCHGKFV